MRNVLFLLWFLVYQCAFAQQADYLKVRDAYKSASCGQIQKEMIDESLAKLHSLDTTAVTQNLHVYYQDIATGYWLLSNDNPAFIDTSIQYSRQALYHNPRYFSSLWSLALAYAFSGRCEEGKKYLALAKKVTRKRYWNKEEEMQLLQRCGEM